MNTLFFGTVKDLVIGDVFWIDDKQHHVIYPDVDHVFVVDDRQNLAIICSSREILIEEMPIAY